MATTIPSLFDRFADAVLPQGLGHALRVRLEPVARYSRARAGDVPVIGPDRDQILFVVQGSTKLVAHASQRREQIVAFHFTGDLVSIPARASHAYSLCALEDCELVHFPADEFFRLARGEPAIVEEVLERAMRALARCREKTISLGRKTAQEKVANFLIVMAERIASDNPEVCELHLPMSRRDIADSLGLTIETVSRQIGELRDAGLLKPVGRSTIILLDRRGLNARAGHLPMAG